MAAKKHVAFRLPPILAQWVTETAAEKNLTTTDVVTDAIFTAMYAHFMLKDGKEGQLGQLLKDLEAKKANVAS